MFCSSLVARDSLKKVGTRDKYYICNSTEVLIKKQGECYRQTTGHVGDFGSGELTPTPTPIHNQTLKHHGTIGAPYVILKI